MKIYDICTYNGESELFEIRYNILKDVVDEFRVIEFDQTFSGKPKPRLFTQNWPKVKSYYITEDIWSKYIDLAKSSPNTEYGKGAEHWIREFAQKESIKDCLTDLKDNDIIYIGDCDEIWCPLQNNDFYIPKIPAKLKLQVYAYWLNNKSTEEFWGTLKARYKDIKNLCLNHIRTNSTKTMLNLGWHFTSMGGSERVKQKLTDSYTEQTYASKAVLDNLEHNIKENKDFLGRNFEYRTDEESWPQYLKENKDKYRYLLK